MVRKLKSILLFQFFVILTFSNFCLAESQIPLKPLLGMSGLKKAIEIQQQTGKPIILWSTWNTCPNTKKVAQWFSSPEVSTKLQEYPRVILESKGKEDEATESQIRGFSSGNFYVIRNYYFESSPYKSIWAWQKDSYTMKKGLLIQIVNSL